MRHPYITCERHCRYFDLCAPTLAVWADYRKTHGRMCPLEEVVQDLHCPAFRPGARVAELPSLEVGP